MHQVYSGTSADLIYAKDLVNGGTGMDAAGRGFELIIVPIFLAFDTPLSVVMDTVFLPMTVPKQFIHGDMTLVNPLENH
ncbi:YceK/YidQ family lipoprotein [Pedosphaera parvula]